MWRRLFSCLRLVLRWGAQVSRLSNNKPRYLTSFEWGMIAFSNVIWGQSPGRREKVTWEDLESLILIFQDLNQWDKLFRWFWSRLLASKGSWLDERIAVSSAYVPIRVLSVVGMSAVNNVYRKGAMSLPWGTPARMYCVLENEVFNLTLNVLLFRYDFRSK